MPTKLRRAKSWSRPSAARAATVFAEGEFTTPLGKAKDLVPNLKDIAAKVTGPQWIYHWIKIRADCQRDDADAELCVWPTTKRWRSPPI